MSDIVIAGLTPAMQPLVRELLRRARSVGLDCVIPATGGTRSQVEQMVNFAKGRHHDLSGRWCYDDPVHHRGVVTNALPATSPHCHRAAVDIMLIERGHVLGLEGSLPPEERVRQLGLYSRLGAIGEELGLVWGGRFTSIHDYDHFEAPGWQSLPVA